MGALRAVKIIGRQHFESDRPYEREFAGIQRYEPVSHSTDGLVHVLHVGRNDAEGYFYYVMELADGEEMQNEKGQIQNEAAPSTAGSDSQRSILNCELYISNYRPRTLRSDLKRFGRLSTADCLRLALEVVSGLAQLHQHGLVHRDV